jgi:NodT family efflux transporter outer membrane factor (OMF) lipoprotein
MTRRYTARWGRIASLAGLAALGACNLAPHYDAPRTEAVPAFKEAVANDAAGPNAAGSGPGWKLADPKDAQIPANWWQLFDDPVLDELENRVAVSNQTVAAAEANYRAARALVAEAQAAFFPTLSLAPTVTRSRSSAALAGVGGVSGTTTGGTTTGGTTTGGTTGTGTTGTGTGTTGTVVTNSGITPHTIYTLPVEASYQLDLWGSVRNAVAQNRYSAEASAAQVVTALLSTQSQLAQDYFQLRAVDEQRRILDATLADYQSSLRLVQTLRKTGIDSDEDLSGAENQLYTAEAQATDLGIARAQYEHAIAVLIGVPPARFSLAVAPYKPVLPIVPLGLPSTLLERRADIAAAERNVAASNAAIGTARAAFFPSLTLSASGGYEALGLSHLLDWPNRFWSVGPAIAQTLFDGGSRRAVVAQAHAQNDQAVANYRQTVLAAFQAVEDNLASLRLLSEELEQRHQATVAAQHTVEASVVRYRNGVDSYVNVVTAQNTFLSSRESELQVQLAQQTASVNLINNLGGGWTASDWSAMSRAAAGSPGSSDGAQATAGEARPGIANPPPLPAPALDPEDLLKRNAESMTPPATDHPM